MSVKNSGKQHDFQNIFKPRLQNLWVDFRHYRLDRIEPLKAQEARTIQKTDFKLRHYPYFL